MLFLLIIVILLGFYTWEEHSSRTDLQRELDHLEVSFMEERKKNISLMDSLEFEIVLRQQQELLLLDSLAGFQHSRKLLKKRSDEHKTTIERIHSIDSLKHEIAKHYR